MLMILLVSGIIMPMFIWLLLYFTITDQYDLVNDGEYIRCDTVETKAEAQRYVLDQTIKSPFFWIYAIYVIVCIFAGACSVNAFYLGDWFFSL